MTIEQLRAAVAEPCRRYHVRRMALFGSAVRGEARADSDLDLLVTFEPDARIGLFAFARMQRELSELLRRKVDLVPEDGLKPAIAAEVSKDAQVIFGA